MPKFDGTLKLVAKSLVSLAFVASGIFVFLSLGQARTDADRTPPEEVRLVEVTPASLHDSGITFTVDGVVVPYREVKLAAEVEGRVIEKADQLRIGRVVRKGEPLVLIDRRDYDLERERLQEELNHAQGNIAEVEVQMAAAEGQIELAQRNLELQTRSTERIRSLVQRNATTEASLDEALRAEVSAQTTLQTQRDQLALLRATKLRLENAKARTQTELATADLQLSRTTITAPIDGVVVEDNVEEDSYLQKGTAVCTIRDTSKLEITSSLHAQQMQWLWQSNPEPSESRNQQAYQLPETPVTVRYRIGNQTYVWDGVLSRYDRGEIDRETRMIPCRVQVDQPLAVRQLAEDGQPVASTSVPTLMVGMYVQVDVHVTPRTSLVNIPVSALYPGSRVWIVRQGQLERREVRVARTQKDSVLVYAGEGQIQPGEQVVVSPLAAPFHGAKVEVAN